jgi:Carboxypeptidase regulatory-like domain
MGIQYPTVTTSSGDYVIPQLPADIYSVTVVAPGFKKLVRFGITVVVSQSARVDLQLALGNTTATVTVAGDAPLLQTESPQNNLIVTAQDFNELPINITGVGAIRDPLMFAELAPGTEANVNGNSWNDIHINGAPGWTYRVLIDGMENTSPVAARISDESQPSVESLAEFSLQQNSYSSEFGGALGGIYNYTTKSGSNTFHGTAFNYLENEAFNAGQPFNYTATGGNVTPPQKQLNFGGTIGGPVIIPHLYDGRNHTFFFFSYEQYHNTQQLDDGLETVPTAAYRRGDLSYQLLGPILDGSGRPVLDCLGRPMRNGQIYNPATTRMATCVTGGSAVVRDPFPNNFIGDPSTWDPVAQKVLNLIPSGSGPTADQPTNNYPEIIPNNKYQYIPGIKVDHKVSEKLHISGYFANQETNKDNWGLGLPAPIDTLRFMTIHGVLTYVDADYVVTPHIEAHAGFGFHRHWSPQSSAFQNIDQQSLLGLPSQSNLPGYHGSTFPYIDGLVINGQTMQQMGGDENDLIDNNYQVIGAVTWVHGTHNFKFGGDMRFESYSNSLSGTTGTYNFAADQTALPSAYGQDLYGASLGNGFASFALGQLNNASIGNAPSPWWIRDSKSIYAADVWKANQKLTINYGIRWDFLPIDNEERNAEAAFSPTVLNPNAGGLPGGIEYEGYGIGRCNCKFNSLYPWMIEPRLGILYQLDPKTVVHVSSGLYSGQQSWNMIEQPSTQGFGWNTAYLTAPSYGLSAGQFSDGFSASQLANITATNFDPGAFTQAGTLQAPPAMPYPHNGRPPRMVQTDIGLQRELGKDLMVEGAWVDERGVWLETNSLVDMQQLDPARLATFGLSLTNPADLQLLAEPISSPTVAARGFTAPYAGFPSGSSLAQALRPYPQFNGLTALFAPLGNWWYDAGQFKLTKRYTHGLSVIANYTWSKDLGTADAGGSIPIQDASLPPKSQKSYLSIDTPQMMTVAFRGELPTYGFAESGWKRAVLKGWTLDGIFKYQSGPLIQTPSSTNNLTSVTFAPAVWSNRVPGQKLFLHSLNSHSQNPYGTFFLNPAAWSNPAPGTYANSKPYYGDYRGPWQPTEQLGLGKITNIREGVQFSVRADFFNVFNRWVYPGLNNTSNPYVTPQSSGGVITNGFGYLGGSIANAGGAYAPRSGEIVARFQF